MRISKLWPSTRTWALSIDLVMSACSIGISSSTPNRPIIPRRSCRRSGASAHLERNIGASCRGLPGGGAAAQLVIDAAGLVAFCSEYMQTARCQHNPLISFTAALAVARAFFTLQVQPPAGQPCRRNSSRATPSGLPPSRISTPRPAILVAIVTAPERPACAIIKASRSCCLAFNTRA